MHGNNATLVASATEEAVSDAQLVRAARAGERNALGLLYLRHGEAAWRMACVSTGFSADAEVALIEGFTATLTGLPGEPDSHSFRLSLLSCVRRIALRRVGRCRPAHPPGNRNEADLRAGEPNPVEIVRHIPEVARSALWLTEVEAMTPAETAAILGITREAVSDLVEEGRDHLYRARGPAGAGPTTWSARAAPRTVLLAALPPLPLLGGECQLHWQHRTDQGALPQGPGTPWPRPGVQQRSESEWIVLSNPMPSRST